MPIYEYRCESDGTVLELIRPMSQADAPVPDPDGKGRTFKRVMSAFQSPASDRSLPVSSGGGGGGHVHSGSCGCGRFKGPCGG